ncbi:MULTISPECIES: FCD domain-containing protein [unclassified Sphingomonas]|uniref:FadR/GntR family transcriptional regulator n=1 Tax=unclassified Sphingomonas TaxID=196159 RepID=UPI002269B8BF|nr:MULTISPECIES: FCD domain-containing protein [unclassified Sphingomonas]
MRDLADDLSRFRLFIGREATQEGDKLPPENELAEKMGVSRSRIRRLLKEVEQEGLIWRHVGKGTFVGSRSFVDALPELSERITPSEAFEARLLIEPRLAALAAINALPTEIDKMNNCLAQMRATDNHEVWGALDARLHRLVAGAARNTLLLVIYDAVRQCVPSGLKFRIKGLYQGGSTTSTDDEHAAWIEAIADHDPPRAERLMREHIESVRERLFGGQ